MADKRYLEDFVVGERQSLGARTVTAEDIVDFARDYDPQPFHLDEAAAAKSAFGGLVASGWHVGAMAMRLLADNLLSKTASLGSPGLDKVQWLQPVRPGDTLSMSGEVLQVTVSIGMAVHDGHPDYERLLQQADQALYQAKHGGRNRCVLYAG